MFCSVIFDRLADNGRTYQQATSVHLSNYAEDGLRTLLFAYKKINSDEYEKWSSVFTKAKATIGPEREELLENASEMIEKDMLLLGAVAIEDKLQKGVSSLFLYSASINAELISQIIFGAFLISKSICNLSF